MSYEKAKADIVTFDGRLSMIATSYDEDFFSVTAFFAKYITPTSQNFYPLDWPPTKFHCGVFTLSGTYHIKENGVPVTVVLASTEEEYVYSCSYYKG